VSYVSVAPSSPPIGALASLASPVVSYASSLGLGDKLTADAALARKQAAQAARAALDAGDDAPGDGTGQPAPQKYLIGAAVLVGAILLLRRR
jgi:hypothetical protein